MIGAVIELAAKIITGVKDTASKKLRIENKLLKAVLKKTNQKNRIEDDIQDTENGKPIIRFDRHR